MKRNQSRPGFELVSPCPYLTTITITRLYPYVGESIYVFRVVFEYLFDRLIYSLFLLKFLVAFNYNGLFNGKFINIVQ